MFLLLLAYLAFLSLALPDGMLGVAWPSMRISLDEPLDALGWLLPFAVGSYLASAALADRLVARLGLGRLLALSTFGTAAALVGTGLAPAFWVTIAASVLHGLSSGAIDASLNSHAARTFTPTAINVMHACYGIGAALSPLLVTGIVVADRSWRWAYLIVAGLQLGIAIAFLASASRWPAPPPASASGGPVAGLRAPRRVAVLGVVAVGVQSAFESSLSLWCFVFLTQGAGVPTATAGLAVSGYWVALCATRLLIGPVADRVGPWPVQRVAAGCLVIFAALLVPGLPLLAVIAVIGLGIAAAPLYPLLMLTTRDRANRVDRVVGLQTVASGLGAVILPGLLGMIIEGSPGHFAMIMAGMAGLVLLLQVGLLIMTETRVNDRMS
ncbi:MFS transporter [Microlunatus parietis]|uniref:MFS family permease n=1 Tax=Microlunatus parietis TaxID=682979 RepID=A0A7Y9LCY0_9ACTN|nr:MFS transporter [Microlunatus parietis]NYE75314.1 MFS family permease [Microlunatus parietis]